MGSWSPQISEQGHFSMFLFLNLKLEANLCIHSYYWYLSVTKVWKIVTSHVTFYVIAEFLKDENLFYIYDEKTKDVFRNPLS